MPRNDVCLLFLLKKMILYNVTVNIENAVADEWLQWMKEVHVPDVMRTGIFIQNTIFRIFVS